MPYRRCGRSGLKLPAISLGLWHNFGDITPFGVQQKILRTAFDNGITHFDLANNYGPPYGEAERNFGEHMLIHQPNYSMFNRSIEHGLTDVLTEEGVGIMAFGPLAGGKLTGRYLNGIPEDSRAIHDPRFLRASDINENLLRTTRALNAVAERRGQTLAQLALVWALRLPAVTSALIGASKPEQVAENVKALDNMNLSEEELNEIDAILANR